MKWFLFFFLLLLPIGSEAYYPEIVNPENVSSYITIEDPRYTRTYFGELTDFPHTYTFVISEPMLLRAKIMVPDTETAKHNKSGLIVKTKNRGVEEVARMRAADALWSEYYASASGDSYRVGPEYEAEIAAGEYLLEISTPDNDGQYVLIVGTQKHKDGLGYFELLGRIYEVKKFLGKSGFSMIRSPFVYVPLALVVVLISVAFYAYRYRRKNVDYAR